jgi:hypothetical protein
MEKPLHVKVHRSGLLYVPSKVFNQYRELSKSPQDTFWLTREMEVSRDIPYWI